MGELAETTPLLRVRRGNLTEGSNPSLSATNPLNSISTFFYFSYKPFACAILLPFLAFVMLL